MSTFSVGWWWLHLKRFVCSRTVVSCFYNHPWIQPNETFWNSTVNIAFKSDNTFAHLLIFYSIEFLDKPSSAEPAGKGKKKKHGGQWIIDCIEATHLPCLPDRRLDRYSSSRLPARRILWYRYASRLTKEEVQRKVCLWVYAENRDNKIRYKQFFKKSYLHLENV